MTAPFLTPRIIPKIGLAPIAITMTSMSQCQIENDSISNHPRPRASFARFVFALLASADVAKEFMVVWNLQCRLPAPEADSPEQSHYDDRLTGKYTSVIMSASRTFGPTLT
jgi:hypothetical protein